VNWTTTEASRDNGDVDNQLKGEIMSHIGKCFCGAVALEVAGSPEAMGYCHCNSCRSWSGGPVNAFSLWKEDAVKVKSGAEHIATFQKTDFSQRKYCKICGGHLMTGHKPAGLIDVFAATIPTLEFSPAVHVNYAETVLRIKDGLPKMKDFPAEMGGSGDLLPE
jgi:hypothetical protein